jgi:hypothetical protein
MVPVTLPMVVFDEQRAINRVSIWVATVGHMMPKEYSREWLEKTLRRYLREGGLSIATKAALAGDLGDEIADAALRDVFGEMVGGVLVPRGEGHLQIWAYGHRANKRSAFMRRGYDR